MIYVTGASGFIGSHLNKRLGGIPIPHDDIADRDGYCDWATKKDVVYFLSSYGNIYGQADAELTVVTNALDPILVSLTGARVVYFSSSSVKLKVQNAYMRSKRAAEEALLARGNACIIRPYTVIGVGDNPKHLVPTLIHSVLYGNQIEFFPWGTHDYIDVDDVVDATINLAPHDGVFEVGTGRLYTNAEILAIVEKVTGGTVNYKVVDSMRPYDTLQWPGPDGSARLHGWTPKKDVCRSIEEMVSAAVLGGVGA